LEIDVLIVDDHGLVREGLRSVLDGESGIRVVEGASSAATITSYPTTAMGRARLITSWVQLAISARCI
jgi:DNA-binding NarL/FixJ family response regulator